MVFIKQVVLKGFRSYKNQTVLSQPFSPHANCVVGANGSGKSNFFFAIRFVLGDMFSSLHASDHKALLHEGAGEHVMSAYVEITFDNSDHRFPVEREEVTLRRSIGYKKDEYFLNKKHVTKQEVNNLLESAGFSRSNPYYIVQQGKVNELTLMQERGRLELLKEVAGTRVYDERRDASLKIIKETDGKREKIAEVLGYFDQRLAELDEEKEELREFQTLDKRRRGLEYTLYQNELGDAEHQLAKIDENRRREGESAAKAHENVDDAHRRQKEAGRRAKRLATEADRLAAERATLEEERRQLVRRRAQLQVRTSELETRARRDDDELRTATRELKELRVKVANTEAELATVLPQYEEADREARRLEAELAVAEQRLADTYARGSRHQQFNSKRERDAHLREQISELNGNEATQQERIVSLKQEIEEFDRNTASANQEAASLSAALEKRVELVQKTQRGLEEMRRRRDECGNARKEAWRQLSECTQQKNQLSEEVREAESALASTASKSVIQGLQAVKRIAEEHSIAGVYGPLCELFTCSEDYYTAVEAAAGGSIFNVVVDTDATAARVLEILGRERAGRVTFIPLNRLRVSMPHLPETANARPLLGELACTNPTVQPALAKVFGRSLVCADMPTAVRYSREYGLHCITLDGDKVDRKGALTGGVSSGAQRSRMKCVQVLLQTRDALQDLEARSEKTQQIATEADQEVSLVMGQIHKHESKLVKAEAMVEQQQLDLNAIRAELRRAESMRDEKMQTVQQLESGLLRTQQVISGIREELTTPFEEPSSQNAEAEQQLQAELQALHTAAATAATERAVLERQRNALRITLSDNLLRRVQELEHRCTSLEMEAADSLLAEQKRLLEETTEAVDKLADQLQESEKAIRQRRDEVASLRQEAEGLRADEIGARANVQTESKTMERLLAKRSLILQRREECMRHIRELGSLPADASEFASLRRSELMSQLHQTNEALKQYTHVNKKAYAQYNTFTEQRESLLQRQQELDTAAAKIQELIEALDHQKDAAIERTFKHVALNFKELFKKLVPHGTASLVMRRKADAESDDDDARDDRTSDAEDADQQEEKYSSSEEQDENVDSTQSAQQRKRKDKGKEPEERASGKRKRGKKATKASTSSSASSSSSSTSSHIQQYTGIAIRVSFTGKANETFLLQQLSGGQKSLVALALIFAIQQCDPAPFYLFDEIDAALDPAHRTAVANMIREQSQSTQFIYASFGKELVAIADQCYGITFRNKVSSINLLPSTVIAQQMIAQIHPSAGGGISDDLDA